MKAQTVILFFVCLCTAIRLPAQQIEISSQRKAVRTSGDVAAVLLPAAGLTGILICKDWQGLKQGALAGITTLGVTTALKYIVDKERPDKSNHRSFPSMHTSVAFTAATFIGQRYGWKWGLPACALVGYVGWTRVYGKKHDWWDVAAGAAIGIGSTFIYTRPFAQKHQLTVTPVAGDGFGGFYAAMTF